MYPRQGAVRGVLEIYTPISQPMRKSTHRPIHTLNHPNNVRPAFLSLTERTHREKNKHGGLNQPLPITTINHDLKSSQMPANPAFVRSFMSGHPHMAASLSPDQAEPKLQTLADKVAIISGSSKGIGAAVAIELASR